MLISRLPQGGGKGELHGASILVTVEDDGLIGQTVELYFGSELFKDGVISGEKNCLFTNILEIGTYTAKIDKLESTAEVTGDNIVKLETVTISVASGIELTIGNTYTFDGYDWTCSANGGSYWVLSRSGASDYNLVKADYRLEGSNDIVAIDAPERLYLYDLGDEVVSITNGYEAYKAQDTTAPIPITLANSLMTRESDGSMKVVPPTETAYKRTFIYSKNKVSLVGYKTLHYVVSANAQYAGSASIASSNSVRSFVFHPLYSTNANKEEVIGNVEAYQSDYYLSLELYNNDKNNRFAKIYKIWLEK